MRHFCIILRYLSEQDSGGILPPIDDVMIQLQDKHPSTQKAQLGSLVFGPIEDITHVIFHQINGEIIKEVALETKGSGSPSGIDLNGFRKMLASKSFKKSSASLCDAMAMLAKRLCTELLDPATVEPILASRLIPLDKGNGEVRPIVVGEVVRRIIAKCATRVTKQDIIEASGPLQVCAGLKSGAEAAIYAMHGIFDADDADAVLLIDASNAFNSLNRASALHNVAVLCPTLATYAPNTFRASARHFVTGGKKLKSTEGTTQGDPLAVSFSAISLQPLITHLNLSSNAKQCWYTDDATCSGSLEELRKWWDGLNEMGPSLGYYLNAKKCWLVTKPEKENEAMEVFSDTAIKISTQGQKHLGTVLGSRTYLKKYMRGKVEDWVEQVAKLAGFVAANPKASYAAFTIGLKHRWTYYLRTRPDIEELLEPLERAIGNVLIPAMTGHTCTPAERELLPLPVRLRGLGPTNPCRNAT